MVGTTTKPFSHDQATTVIPGDLRVRPQWVIWRGEPDPKKPGRIKKVPYIPDLSCLRHAKSNDPQTWGKYEEAVKAQGYWEFDGVMFAFTPQDDFAGTDLDDCRNPETGVLDPWAQRLIAAFQTYTEVSPSGTGVKLWLRGKLPGEGKGRHRDPLEVYDRSRFFTVTGQHLEETPRTVEARQEALDWLYIAIPILAKALERDGERFSLLFAGRWQETTKADGAPFDSESEADLAFCDMLVVAGAKTEAELLAAVQLSGLYDEKWKREDYQASTIGKALKRKGSGTKTPPNEQTVPRLQAQSARVIVAKHLPPVRWIVPGLIPEGATLIAGNAKIGKSWAMLALGLGVATGKRLFKYFDTIQGDVLYLALEDSDQRLQERLDTLLGDEEAPDNLYITYDCSPLPLLVEELRGWVTEHPETRLIIVDVVAKVRQIMRGNRDNYLEDYKAVSSLQRFALDAHLGVVGVTHTNQKEEASDILHTVSGTTGQVGSADTILLLRRTRNGTQGELHVIGRDVTEGVLGVEFRNGVWVCKGQPDSIQPGPEPTMRTKAETFLQSYLADGSRLSGELEEAAKAQGITPRTLDRARTALGVKAEQLEGKWYCCLPTQKSDIKGEQLLDPWNEPLDHEADERALREFSRHRG